jgi:CPA1 family monovalent cation:H+ antiporter
MWRASFSTAVVLLCAMISLAGGNLQAQKVSPQEGRTMQSVNWPDFFKHHPTFSSLNEAEVGQLLKGGAAQERAYPPGSVIITQGDPGDSVFLIGAGSVQVTIGVPVAVLKEGEFFGEIAAIERKPRTATVSAKENCLLLEVTGEEFRKLLAAHPEIQSKVYAKMSTRLSRPSQP